MLPKNVARRTYGIVSFAMAPTMASPDWWALGQEESDARILESVLGRAAAPRCYANRAMAQAAWSSASLRLGSKSCPSVSLGRSGRCS